MKQETNTIIKSRISWTAAIILVIVWALLTVLPFVFMVLNSFKDRFEMLVSGVFQLPKSFNFSNYQKVINGNFLIYVLNSIIVLAVSLAILLFISACASYALARFKFKLNKALFAIIVACMAIPMHITLIPVFKMTQTMGLYDTIWSLIGPYVAFGIPISVFILTGFMKSIPYEIEEAASIDGCSRYRMFSSIMLPLAKPGLATLAIYNGVSMWNEFSFSYTLTQSVGARTLPLAVWDFQGQYSMNIPMIMAVLTLTILPIIILFLVLQDKLIEGITAGAVKG